MSEESSLSSSRDPPGQSRGSGVSNLDFYSHPLISKYWPSERRAILVHRYYLSHQLRREATLEEALTSWESGICGPWRRNKMRRDCQQQLKEIERHKYLVSKERGYDIGWDTAAQDWIGRHAAAWREWWESQPESGESDAGSPAQ
ncbi:MAG TPA: hypothetical protein VMT52_09415 [Planctomycetota bacterium]|nr:hypothetical protein [Planctomycetota bacterium]